MTVSKTVKKLVFAVAVFALAASPSVALFDNSAPGVVTILGATPGGLIPGTVVAVGVNTDGVVAVPHICGLTAKAHITTATDTQLVAADGSKNIYVCDYEFSSNGTNNVYLEKSTSGTCGSPTAIGQTWYTIANSGKIASNAYYRGMNTGASGQLCVNTSAAQSFDITVYYDQY